MGGLDSVQVSYGDTVVEDLGLYTVITQECDDEVIRQCHQVHRVPKEVRNHVIRCYQWHEEELEDIEESPDW